MKKKNDIKLFKQLASYFMVGGMAAIVEWIGFFLFNKVFAIHYILATALSFIGSTYANWILGRKITFKHHASGMKLYKEIFIVYGISCIGLLLNILLMFIFVGINSIDTMFAKVMSTGIVFLWNFTARKLFVYKI